MIRVAVLTGMLVLAACGSNYISSAVVEIEARPPAFEVDTAGIVTTVKSLGFEVDDEANIGGHADSIKFGMLEEVAGYKIRTKALEVYLKIMRTRGGNLLIIVSGAPSEFSSPSSVACKKYKSIVQSLVTNLGVDQIRIDGQECK